jgi:hypothetical protein
MVNLSPDLLENAFWGHTFLRIIYFAAKLHRFCKVAVYVLRADERTRNVAGSPI